MQKECSEIGKSLKKVKKVCEKVLTFRVNFDKIYKLTRAEHRGDGTEP